MCCTMMMQAEIVHHEKCDPTYRTVGYTQDCWEDTETGKLYAEVECTNELNPAYVVTYKKLKANPTSGWGELVEEAEYVDCKFNWSKEIRCTTDETGKRACEFKVHGTDVSNARLKCQYDVNNRYVTLQIFVNGNSIFYVGSLDNFWGNNPNLFTIDLPDLKTGDVVKFEINLVSTSIWIFSGTFFFASSLEYTSSNGGTVTLLADDKQKFKGADDPQFTWHYLSPSLSIDDELTGITASREEGEDVGTYKIHVNQAEGANPKYEIDFFDGELEIIDGIYHEKGEPYSDGLIYIQSCWEETATGKYYANGYKEQELISDAVIGYPKLAANPITNTDGFTVVEKAFIKDLSHSWILRDKYGLDYSLDWVAIANFGGNESGKRSVEFTAFDDGIIARLPVGLETIGYASRGDINLIVYKNGDIVYSREIAESESIDDITYVSLPNLKKGDVIKLDFERKCYSGYYTDIYVFTCLQYIAPRELCFTANTAGSTVQLKKVGEPYETALEYYTTSGTTWQPYTFGTPITLAKEGDKVYFRNASDDLAKGFSKDFMSNYYQFAMTGSVAASGSVMSLLDKTCRSTTFPYDDGDYTTPEDFNYFVNLFSGCTSLTSAPELPATKLTPYCYMWMFKDCTGLTSAPELPAMALSDWCYGAMFEGCTGLEKAPALPATTMASNCYAAMFRGCTGLTEAPELPAMTLAGGCYSEMFENCTNLETAPTLPATTLELNCYDKMFNGCSKLNLMRVGFTEWTNYTTNNWLNGVASTGTFACPEELDKTQTGASNIPEGWITGPYTFTITANSSDESKGTVSGGGTYANGDKIILTATPAEDCAFKHWSDGTTANPYVFTATKDVTLTATFVTIFNVQASPADESEGSVTGSGKYEEGTEVTLTATPAENYAFEKWSDGTTANPYVFTATKNVTLTALFKEYTRYITDGTEYTATESKFLPEVIYTRTFKNTDWQALYVPFSMDYEEWCEDYDIARVYNFIDYDDNDDGEFDRTYLVVKKMTSGSTKPNYPYLIRAKATGAQTLTLTDKTLEPAQSNSVECSSTDYTYTFTGSYTEVANMYANSYYALSGGSLQGANSPSVVLKPQRWYMSITPKSGDYSATRAQNIKVLVDGEDDTEGIEAPSTSPKGESPVAYDLMGRGVKGAVKGVSIVNGKKIIN